MRAAGAHAAREAATRLGIEVTVVRPSGISDVQAAVKYAAEQTIPIHARGAGTGLSGAANAGQGWVVVSFERMNRVLEVDPVQQTATVQPGVVNDVLRERVAQDGLWYPPDPASAPWSTIGGNVATNAGGLCCVKYGVTRDYVLGLEVVLPGGEVIHTGGRTAKNVAGYDLTHLVVGSEGTLGVVTEITLRLVPLAEAPLTAVASFDSVADAARTVADRFTCRSHPAVPRPDGTNG